MAEAEVCASPDYALQGQRRGTLRATCQVVHATTGRLRLSVPDLEARPENAQLLATFLLQLSGVTGVQVHLISASIIIECDPACCTPDSIMRALRGEPAEVAAGTGRKRPERPVRQAESSPYADCTVIHAIPGRVRLRIPVLKASRDLGSVLAQFLHQQEGIEKVRLSPLSESVIIQYDATIWNGPSLVKLVRAFEPDPVVCLRSAKDARPAHNVDEHQGHMIEAVLAGSALALSLIGGTAGAPAVLALLWASSRSIFQRAYDSLVGTLFYDQQLTVDTLDAAAIALLSLNGMLWQAALLNLLLSSGEWIRANTKEQARQELAHVLDCMVDSAWVRHGDQIVSIPAEEVKAGDTVFVYPGERIPVDGIVTGGRALVDQHALTGESMPVVKSENDQVYAATVAAEGELRVWTTRTGRETRVAKIVQLVQQAPLFDTRAQDYAERWANRLVPLSFLGAGVLALLGRFSQAIAVLVIDYAAAFRVAAPTTVMSTLISAARHGIFIRGGRHVEQLAEVDALIFDKTGTLTIGCPEVVEIVPLRQRFSADEVLALAAGAEQNLTHPVAHAVVQAAAKRDLAIPQRESFEYQIGLGVVAHIDGRTVILGSRRYLEAKGIHFSRRVERILRRTEALATSPLCIAVDGKLVGLLGLADTIRPEASTVVQALRKAGIHEITMSTGDRSCVAEVVSRTLTIDRHLAEAFPGDKLAAVKALQEQGYKVAVVGDGINDSPALAQADVGIAVNGGTALAQESADVVIVDGGLEKLVTAIEISREGMALIRQNWKVVRYPNTFGIGLAFVGAIGPLGASLISDGAALAAGVNSLRPLMPRNERQQVRRNGTPRRVGSRGNTLYDAGATEQGPVKSRTTAAHL
jgi:heavy metal translocating P-type ATPase